MAVLVAHGATIFLASKASDLPSSICQFMRSDRPSFSMSSLCLYVVLARRAVVHRSLHRPSFSYASIFLAEGDLPSEQSERSSLSLSAAVIRAKRSSIDLYIAPLSLSWSHPGRKVLE